MCMVVYIYIELALSLNLSKMRHDVSNDKTNDRPKTKCKQANIDTQDGRTNKRESDRVRQCQKNKNKIINKSRVVHCMTYL